VSVLPGIWLDNQPSIKEVLNTLAFAASTQNRKEFWCSMSKIDRTRLLFLCGLVVSLFVPGSFHAFPQDVGSAVLVNPPLHTKGNAQPSVVGLTPSQVRHAYGFDLVPNQGAGQTIAVIEAFGSPQIEKDLAVFNQTFNLPDCTVSNGCLRILTTSTKNLNTNQLWALETSLDVEWAHAIAPDATIMVVESPDAVLNDMLQAVDFAVSQGATVVSMSWGGLEFPTETTLDTHFNFSVPNVSFVAAAGDFGSLVIYPSASPYVLSVGGTTLSLNNDGSYAGEVAWSGSGGGLSSAEPEPNYQQKFHIPNDSAGARGNPDVAYDAGPDSSFAVYATHKDGSQGSNGWIQVFGTSAGAPQWAGLIALARSLGWSPTSASATPAAMYSAAGKSSYSTNFHDVVAGSNGTCGVLCTAAPGYDYVTGLGSPQVQNLIKALVP
jgi:subtilase family serine protease